MRRGLVAVHRWLGVALSLNFFLWFLSGIGMMYWDFPSVSPADRLARAPLLDGAAITVTLAEALDAAGLASADDVRLDMFDGRPVYRLHSGPSQRVVYADTLQVRGAISRAQVDRSASEWVGQRAELAAVDGADAVDQWTVQLPLSRLTPVWKYSWPDGEQVYVSQASGEVVQYTTRASRLGAYAGAIPHWLYVTPLRKHGPLWSAIVIALSGTATIVAALGLMIGVWTFSPSRRYRHGTAPVRLPYRGWKRWHAILGLIVGVAAITWAFSGMLSMDPFPLPGDPPHTDDVARALRGTIRAATFQAVSPQAALAALAPSRIRQLELIASNEAAFYLATLESSEVRIVDLAAGIRTSFETEQVARQVAAVIGPDEVAEARLLDQYDRYYLDRHRSRPLPVVLVRVGDRDDTRFYIDPKTARLVGAYSARNWMTRWLYHGLHSFDFPWLYRYRPLWDLVVGAFMVSGAALCFTSLILAWRVVGRTLSRRLAPDITVD